MKYNKNVYLGAGHRIYSVRATKLFTIVADTMGGGHDTIGGCCSAASNMFPHPILLDGGTALFKDVTERRALRLLETKPLESGLILLT
jgi:uncharacterized protein YcgI (DUF1989 family)